MLKLLVVLPLLVLANADYSGHKLIDVTPKNQEQHDFLLKLVHQGKIDILRSNDETYEVLVAPETIPEVMADLFQNNVDFQVSDVDLQAEIEKEAERLAKKEDGFDYEDFNNLDDIYTELDRLAAKCIPGFLCSIDSIGLTIESRQIKRLKIVKKGGGKRKVVWLDATTHAREWLTTATFMKIVNHLVHNYTKDKDAAFLLDNFDWHLLPVINPDGYIHSWTQGNRMYRKNKRVNKLAACPGVDLNRNADYAWGTQGASSNPCAQTFYGLSPASEPETRAINKAVLALKPSLVHFISLHSYGQYWLVPFGNIDPTTNRCFQHPDDKESLRVANAAANAIEKVYSTKWKRGSACSTIYPASGLLVDWVKASGGVKYTAVPEVRGSNFIVPPSEIPFSFNEIWAGVVAAQRAMV